MNEYMNKLINIQYLINEYLLNINERMNTSLITLI